MMPFLLGLLVGLVAPWFYHHRQRHSLAYWKKRLSQTQASQHELDQRHEQLTQEHQKIQQQSQELERKNQQLHQQLADLHQENNALLEQQTKPTQIHQQKEQELQQQITKLQHENQTLTSFCNYFEKCAISTEERYISLQEQYNSLQQEYLQLQAQFNHSKYNNHTTLIPTSKANNQNVITLYTNEPDLYQDEIYEFILRLIDEEMNRLPDQDYKRRRDLLKSLLECNPSEGHSHQIRTHIEDLFSDYTCMTRRLETRLKQLGFSLTEGNHYRIIWQEDQRYAFSFARTPSDYRAGRNIARDLIHLLF